MKYSSITIPLILIFAIACNNYCSHADETPIADTTVVVDTTIVVAIDTIQPVVNDSIK